MPTTDTGANIYAGSLPSHIIHQRQVDPLDTRNRNDKAKRVGIRDRKRVGKGFRWVDRYEGCPSWTAMLIHPIKAHRPALLLLKSDGRFGRHRATTSTYQFIEPSERLNDTEQPTRVRSRRTCAPFPFFANDCVVTVLCVHGSPTRFSPLRGGGYPLDKHGVKERSGHLPRTLHTLAVHHMENENG